MRADDPAEVIGRLCIHRFDRYAGLSGDVGTKRFLGVMVGLCPAICLVRVGWEEDIGPSPA